MITLKKTKIKILTLTLSNNKLIKKIICIKLIAPRMFDMLKELIGEFKSSVLPNLGWVLATEHKFYRQWY